MKQIEDDEMKLLVNIYDKNRASILESKLEANNIHVLSKVKGVGAIMDIMMGDGISEIGLYVATKDLEDAKKIIEIDKDYIPEQYRVSGERKVKLWVGRIVIGIILLIMFLQLIISIFWLVGQFGN